LDHHDLFPPPVPAVSWALDEFYTAVSEEFGVDVEGAEDGGLSTAGEIIDFVVENTTPTDGMDSQEHRDHVAGVIGEIMARILGVTRYTETSPLVELGGR
jgi:hypothetical protein